MNDARDPNGHGGAGWPQPAAGQAPASHAQPQHAQPQHAQPQHAQPQQAQPQGWVQPAAPGGAPGHAGPGPAAAAPAAGWQQQMHAAPADAGPPAQGAAAHPGQPHFGQPHLGQPSQPGGWHGQAAPGPHAGPAIHQHAAAVDATGLGASTGQAYLAMFTNKPLPQPRLVGAGMVALALLVAFAQAGMVLLGGVYTWEGMLLLFCSGVPGAWLVAMGDPPDPQTGLALKSRRIGLIASFVGGVVLAFAASMFLVWVVGTEPW